MEEKSRSMTDEALSQQLRCRFAGELSWFAGMIDVFRDL